MDIFRTARQNFLRRQAEADQADLERQAAREDQQQARTQARTPEMQEQPAGAASTPQMRPSPMSSMLHRFTNLSRPSAPSFVGRQSSHPSERMPGPRPTSSRYDAGASDIHSAADDAIVSPKTPQFALGMPPLPSTRLHLPQLQRTWTQGSNGPPSRPNTSQRHRQPSLYTVNTHSVTDFSNYSSTGGGGSGGRPSQGPPMPTEPVPAVPAQHVQSASRGRTERGQESSGRRHRHHHDHHRHHRRFNGSDPAELHLMDLANDGRERRRRHRHERNGSGSGSGSGNGSGSSRNPSGQRPHRHRHHHSTDETKRPRRFMLCFPWVRSRRMRSLVLRVTVSGLLMALMLTVYLALSLTRNINNSEFSVVLILIILFTTVFFCHGLVRICMLLAHPPTPEEEAAQEMRRRHGHAGPFPYHPDIYGPGGYVVPRQPIRVVLARDEEAAGVESVTAKIQPPAYGLWRESVRVDPNRIYWQRNDSTPEMTSANSNRNSSSSSNHNSSSGGDVEDAQTASGHGRNESIGGQRPPSYVSEDGVSYVVEAQPRSTAPTTAVPLPPHPAEAGRISRPAPW